MKKTLFIANLLLAIASVAPLLASAENLQVPLASQGGALQAVDRPTAGMNGKTVLARYGEPVTTSAPVGNPPISRWEYPDFYVYFEYNHVVHTVLKHRRNSQR